jgi:hypothetical protein
VTSPTDKTAPVAKPTYLLFVGVDIAARTFTASQLKPGGELCLALSFKQDSDDFTQLQK